MTMCLVVVGLRVYRMRDLSLAQLTASSSNIFQLSPPPFRSVQGISGVIQRCTAFTRVPVCYWSPCSGAQIPASCVLACYWSMAVCYWGSSQSQTTTQLAGIWAPLHGDQQHTGTLVDLKLLLNFSYTFLNASLSIMYSMHLLVLFII